MNKLGCIGSSRYENKRKIKEILYKLKNKIGPDLEIITWGNNIGAESYIKKYSLHK